MFTTFSLEFGWTPDQIRRITLQEMEHYLHQLFNYRRYIRRPEESLTLLYQVVAAFLGVKEPKKLDAQAPPTLAPPLDGQANDMGSGLTLTREEAHAWEAAGMPSPLTGWLEGYRHGRR